MKELSDFIIFFKSQSPDNQQSIVDKLLLVLQGDLSVNLLNHVSKDKCRIACPHCHSHDIQANGRNKNVQRYRCTSCLKNFSDSTGTALYWLKKKDKWPGYLHCMLQGYSLRGCAEEVDISLPTSFAWRHKILSAFKTASAERFTSILESDEIFFRESQKGSKNLSRPARKRGGKASKAGISKEQVAVILAKDRQNNSSMDVSTFGRISKANLDGVFGDKIEQETILCTDSHRSYSAFARSKKLKHEKIIANKGQYVKDQVFHVQNVNNSAQRLRKWMVRFNGVATKYLQNYLNWFMVLEKIKTSPEKITGFAAFAVSSNQAWFDFKNIPINQLIT